jgi:hypothetical protein
VSKLLVVKFLVICPTQISITLIENIKIVLPRMLLRPHQDDVLGVVLPTRITPLG